MRGVQGPGRFKGEEMKDHSFDEYVIFNCEFTKKREDWNLFIALYERTNGDVCDTGCAYKNRCSAYSLLHQKKPFVKPTTRLKTNAELSKELGVSKRQASKLRRNKEEK